MDQNKTTVVSPEMYEQMKKLGLAGGYEAVPDEAAEDARRLLKDQQIAEIDEALKKKLAEIEQLERREVPQSTAGFLE